MTPGLRKFMLTTHVASSVGWLGAVAGFLALAVAGLTSGNAQMVRGAYLAMDLTGWFVIVPLSLASLLTGLVMSLGTTWGLFRHHWVLAKLLIAVLATVLLLVHMQPVGHLAAVVAETTLAQGELAGLRVQLVADAGAAVVALLAATAFSVFKPPGLTRYGRRKLQVEGNSRDDTANAGLVRGSTGNGRRWVYVFPVIVGVLGLLLLIKHLAGGGLGGHAPR